MACLCLVEILLSVWALLFLTHTTSFTVRSNQTRWLLFVNNHTYEEYWLYKDRKSWEESRDTCVAKKGHLAVIKDQQTQDQIGAALTEVPNAFLGEPWIGGRRLANQSWNLPDVSAHVQPQDYFCAYLKVSPSGTASYRADHMCDDRKRYICTGTDCNDEKDCDVTSEADDMLTYEEAIKACSRHGKLLKSQKLAADHKEEQVLPEAGEFWVGLHYQAWQWVTGDTMFFTHKYFGISVSMEHHQKGCLTLWPGGHWVPRSCSEKNIFICQISNDPTFSQVIGGAQQVALSTTVFLISTFLCGVLTVPWCGWI